MATQTFTFNQENWSGETATITVKNNKFEFNGYDFELGEVTVIPDEKGNKLWDFYSMDLLWEGKVWATIYRFGGDECWGFDRDDFCRTHKEPAVLCAIAAANLI